MLPWNVIGLYWYVRGIVVDCYSSKFVVGFCESIDVLFCCVCS